MSPPLPWSLAEVDRMQDRREKAFGDAGFVRGLAAAANVCDAFAAEHEGASFDEYVIAAKRIAELIRELKP